MNIAYFGTGEFSKNVLQSLLSYENINIKLVVSQIDKIVGRKKELTFTHTKKLALEKNIPILQPETLKDNKIFEETLKSLNLDFIIVVAYGKIIPTGILNIPKYGSINIHGSILPLYRGASPIQESIKNGDKKTGLTIMYMSEKMDEGDILAIKEVDIDILDTTGDIFRKFEQIGPELLYNTLKNINNIKPQKQNHDKATYCKKIEKQNGQIYFINETVVQIYNKFRAYNTWPGIYTYYKGKKLDITDLFFEENDMCYFDTDFKLGDVIEFEDHDVKNIGILCNKGILILKKVKLEGKKEMNIFDFVNGNKDFLEYNFI